MSTYSKKTPQMDLYIEDHRGTILIKQKWRYTWLNALNSSVWTYFEKQEFHKKVDRLVWRDWGSHYYLRVGGSSAFARRHASVRWDVNFDVEWVLSNGHWSVEVTKYPATFGGNPTSSVQWGARVISLDTKDTEPLERIRGKTSYFQYPLVHEFGHASGNSIYATPGMHGDEYKKTSSHYSDRSSLMNIGNQLRERHLDYILSQLNTILPNTVFSKY